MLVSAAEMLKKAKAGHYAVGQFNINNLEWTKAALLTAEECKSPIILGVSEGAGKYMCGFKTVADMVKAMMEELNITVPVALHLDHGTYDGCYKCIKAGFSSIMFDGSHYPIEENVEKTKELAGVCKGLGLSLEAEVGSIGGEEDGVVGMGECADPKECKMIADLGVDMLAAGIGNIHGKYPENWGGLRFDVLDDIQKTENKILELQEHVRQLRIQKKQMEDAEIIKAIRSMKMDSRKMLTFLDGIQNGTVTMQFDEEGNLSMDSSETGIKKEENMDSEMSTGLIEEREDLEDEE